MRGILAPSDLPFATDGSVVSVGGRARWVGQEAPVLHLYDALGAVVTDIGGDVPEASLVVAQGKLERADGGHTLRGARVVRAFAQPRATNPRDTLRFAESGVARLLELRQAATAIVRAYFAEQRFLEVTTPVLVPSPGLDLHLGAFGVLTPAGERFLSTSPEYQMKRLLVGGVPRCFQLAPCFRRDESGRHHNAEFTMLEWYRGFAEVDDVIADTEALVGAVVDGLGTAQTPALDWSRPFERITVTKAFQDHAGVEESAMLEMARTDPETFFRYLVDRVEPALAARRRPVVLERYPREMASLARLCPDDDRYAERFEVYAASLELCNGFGELCDPAEQRLRFERDQRERADLGLPVYPIDERFLEALAGGMPPAAGNALGFDRLVMLAAGQPEIDRVIAFPTGEL
ncbi:MAG: EF-P lysine aminoacylase GenX [Myxococcales bacterium]|nr:EF-P lysine aminoacylase GenX [Myxococcales bacterium]